MSLQIEQPAVMTLNVASVTSNNERDDYFNKIIGCIEDMLVNDEFLAKQTCIMEKYWKEFEENDENKLIYTSIFKEYQDEIESYIENYLQKSVDGFSMDLFIEELEARKDNLNGEIFEILFTLTDFVYFKEMILDYKAMKEGRMLDIANDVVIKKISVVSLDSR